MMEISLEKYELDNFYKDLTLLGIELSEYQIKQFICYYEMLVAWNEKINLTAITDFQDVIKKHFIDSLSLIKAIPEFCKEEKSVKVLDMGTGAGFPGIPLKIAFPNMNIVLCDSLNKRINYLNEVINELQLENITTVHGRAEDFVKQAGVRESFDLVVSRAVANLSTLSEYCIPYVKVGGYFAAYKSEKSEEEIEKAKSAIHILGGKNVIQNKFTLPNSDLFRNIVVIQKEKSTPKKYPRKAGTPTKEPL